MSLASGLPICSICYNEILSANSIKINGCDHEFHKDCLRSSALASVGEHQIPVPCPQCKADRIFMRILGKDQSKFTVEVILDHQLANVFTEEDWNQYYLTSLRVATGNQLVACPNVNCGCEYLVENEEELKCDTTTSSNSSEQSSKESEKSATFLKCVQCKWKWCRACGVPDWHFGKTCKEVAEQTEQVKKQHEAFEKLFDENRRYVRCPNADCNTPLEQREGCNHIRCKMCQHHFCILCRKLLGGPAAVNIYDHWKEYDSPCFGKTYEDPNHNKHIVRQ